MLRPKFGNETEHETACFLFTTPSELRTIEVHGLKQRSNVRCRMLLFNPSLVNCDTAGYLEGNQNPVVDQEWWIHKVPHDPRSYAKLRNCGSLRCFGYLGVIHRPNKPNQHLRDMQQGQPKGTDSSDKAAIDESPVLDEQVLV